MLKRLQEKWKVNGIQFVLVLCTFAIGGSMCGFLGRKVMDLFTIENAFLYGTLYIIIVTLLWPLCVLLISIPFGQFRFFSNYLRKMGTRFGIVKSPEEAFSDKKIHIALLASGGGSNAQRIMEYFKDHPQIRAVMLASNKPGAGALHHAVNHGLSTLILEKDRFFKGDGYLQEFEDHDIDYLILAGFLWKVPHRLVETYKNRIINIHPALLPRYGGKGMYGHHVHEAVLQNRDSESGLTIHLVDEQYDHGKALFQTRVPVLPDDDATSLAARVLEQEHAHFAPQIEKYILESGKC